MSVTSNVTGLQLKVTIPNSVNDASETVSDVVYTIGQDW